MALFTDGAISTVDDLLGYESSILEVAKTEGIDLGIKLQLAQEELGIELTAYLVQQAGSNPGLANVVVTDALRKWHTFQALALIYRDAYNRQLNDRHLAKWKECDRQAKWASTMLFESGVGIVSRPAPRAERPELSSVAGTLPAATYYARVSWVSEGGDEGCPSEPAVLTAPDYSLLQVRAVNPPPNARWWNVYAGLSDSDVTLQNETPLEPGQLWVEAASGLRTGRKPGTGQAPEYYIQKGGQTRRSESSVIIPGLLQRG